MNKSLIIFGSLAYDYQLLTEQKLRVLAQEINPAETSICPVHVQERMFGGNGGNIAFYLAKLQANPILISTVGYDGDSYIHHLQSLGLDTQYIVTNQSIPTTTVWLVQDQASSIAFFDDRASQLRALNVPDPFLKDSIVHIAPGKPHVVLPAMEKVYGLAHTIIWDPGQDMQYFSADEIHQCLEKSSILMLNQHELALCIKQSQMNMETILEKVIVVETQGKRGVCIHEQGRSMSIPALVPEKFVSSWGAGDAFRSGFLHGILKGMTLSQAAEIGCDVASFAVQSQAAQNEDDFTSTKSHLLL